ncbi:hypothetical protein FJU30_20865 [Affinibrenneria salicis]|uniref:Saccharopine dehydrogenase NADP binding domain-containing protein n=1 Tax=Affinibrenneria salicis TaxID=2590031 RepID=A0A5J5FT87_9GAMM|nr:hypothetical protein [Affinibrenneria salicis]KAA8996661.1 hypothetical protein FJU30_20865 [Affinibrenneria salicis]
MRQIGIIGASGAVGGAALALLRSDGYAPKAGYRTRRPGTDPETCWQAVDVYDRISLARFCSGCRVILNAAGPSGQIGDRVLRAADAAGADYVDAFGGALLEQQLDARLPETERRVVHSAGVYPGLSAMLPQYIVDKYFDHAHQLRGWTGGREHCTPAAGMDVLLSAIQGFGLAGAIWRKGVRVDSTSGLIRNVYIPGFPLRMCVQPFLSREIERVARRLSLQDLQWHNVMPDAGPMEVMSRWVGRLGLSDPPDMLQLQQATADLVRASDLDSAGQTPFYRQVVEIEGERHGKRRCVRAVLSAVDSYRVSGAVAACAVLHILNIPCQPGSYTAADFLSTSSVLDKLRAWKVISALSIDVVTPPESESIASEEGTL